ncbi:putative ankyrin repeat protein RF_0381 [Saccostrea cucullata]|uniref:putative ankyrin repeat protein RF_0381 n=1 Tax=Saccostrea cuccullata TaxID=36930 RepID=UPI002ED0733E
MSKYLVNTYPPLLQAKNEYGGNILHAAALGGNIDLFELLLGKGFDIKVNPHDGKNVIISRCMNGKHEICKYFVSIYPHLLHDTDTDGNNALHAAVWGGNINLFKFLLRKGFDINISENEGKTVLHFCCLNGQLDMFKYLVNTYPQLLDVKDNEGENALHAAALGGNLDMLKFLLRKGFDIKTRGGDGKTAFHLCCMNGKLDICRFLIENYPHLLYIKDSTGVNILDAAAWGGHVDLLKFLLGKDLNIKVSSDEGKTVLHFCCMNGKLDMCEYLAENYSLLLYIKDMFGLNVLHMAAWSGNIYLFKFLLEKGFDTKVSSIDGKTVLHQCCLNGKLKMCKYLVHTYPQLLDVKDNDGVNVLHAAAWGGNIDLFNFLLEKDFDFKTTSDGKTVLHMFFTFVV